MDFLNQDFDWLQNPRSKHLKEPLQQNNSETCKLAQFSYALFLTNQKNELGDFTVSFSTELSFASIILKLLLPCVLLVSVSKNIYTLVLSSLHLQAFNFETKYLWLESVKIIKIKHKKHKKKARILNDLYVMSAQCESKYK